jgi:adenine/guanine phosphoribosyltransferase-like PRPP-binding protein
MKASQAVKIAADHLETLRHCDGCYECPVDAQGMPTGLLVGYAGRYGDEAVGEDRQWVGLVYYNFARAEAYPHVLDHYTDCLAAAITATGLPYEKMLGAPMGGITTAFNLAQHLDCQFGFAEKKVLIAATKDSREMSKLVIDRHAVAPGEKIWLVEDVCTNFSTTAGLYLLIAKAGAEVVGIACLMNRAENAPREFILASGQDWELPPLPIVALVTKPTEQFRQDDPRVVQAIAEGRIVRKPKDDWARLMAQ